MKTRSIILMLWISIALMTHAYAGASENKQSVFQSMETRHFLVVILPTEAAAQAFIDELNDGEKFATVADRNGFAVIEIGPITGKDFAKMHGPNLAREAFTLPLRQIVGPTQTRLGWAVVEPTNGPVGPDVPAYNRVYRPKTDWWLINFTLGANARAEFADKSSIMRFSGGVRMWTTSVFKLASLNGRQSSKSYYQFDCIERTAALLSNSAYRKDGSVLGTVQVLPDPIPVPPDSMLETSLDFVCGDAVPTALQLTKLTGENGLSVTPENIASAFFTAK